MKLTTIVVGLCGVASSIYAEIRVIGTTDLWDRNGRNMHIETPSGTRDGDLLLLVTHRTDILPVKLSGGWQRRAECFKTNNGYKCQGVSECVRMEGDYCREFKKGKGRDLAQVIYTKRTNGSESKFNFNFQGNKPAWLILATLRGVDTNDPVRDWAGLGVDKSDQSVFPSVDVRRGDMVILSQSYDNFVDMNRFQAPNGFKIVAYVGNNDETGFLYAKLWNSNNRSTGRMKTNGPGSEREKDALISLSLRAKGEGSAPVCNFSDVKKECSSDGCRNLVWINDYGTCDEYCASQNADCVGAWEDYANSCETEKETPPGWDCTSNYGDLGSSGTSDAICQCEPNSKLFYTASGMSKIQ